jgi:thymidylate synthase ThyX
VNQPDLFDFDLKIERMAEEAHAEIRQIAEAAIEWLNRSIGQKLRRMKEQKQ